MFQDFWEEWGIMNDENESPASLRLAFGALVRMVYEVNLAQNAPREVFDEKWGVPRLPHAVSSKRGRLKPALRTGRQPVSNRLLHC